MTRISYIISLIILLAIPQQRLCAQQAVRQSADSLLTYVHAALRDNPSVGVAYKQWQAALEACGMAGQLADPTLSFGFFPKAMEQVNGKQVMTMELMQMFQMPGAYKSARQQKHWQSQAMWQKYRKDGIALARQVEQQWYTMLTTREQLRALNHQQSLLRDIQHTTLAYYTNATGRLSDQLRLQLELASMAEDSATLAEKLHVQQQQFNLLLHREADSPLVLPDSITLRPMPTVNRQQIEANDPTLLSLTAEERAAEAGQRRAKAMGLPMIGIGIQYMLNKKTDMPRMADMNGMDMFMPMLSVTLPIYRKRIDSEVRAAQHQQSAAQLSYERQVDELQSQVLLLQQRRREYDRKQALYASQLATLAETQSIMLSEYANGLITITDILALSRDEVNYAFKLADARSQACQVASEMAAVAAERVENSIMKN